jgi:[ribosomal protein S18]-alanine N-acetyltransferase
VDKISPTPSPPDAVAKYDAAVRAYLLLSLSGRMCLYSARQQYNQSMANLPLRIRHYCPEDFEPLYRIDQICFASDMAFSREEFLFYLRQPHCIVRILEEAGRVAGFVLGRVESRASAHVITLDVAPERRQCGLATMLMNDLHHELEKRKVQRSFLEVGVENIPAQRLYRKLGYEKVGTLIGYYRGREDAYRMMLALNGRQSSD